MNYKRVVPRDLFNESKLLKCLGKLSVYIVDNALTKYNVSQELEGEEVGFVIYQNPDDGSIGCSNFHVYKDGAPLDLSTPLNSREIWPLYFLNYDSLTRERVLDETGNLTQEFFDYLESMEND